MKKRITNVDTNDQLRLFRLKKYFSILRYL